MYPNHYIELRLVSTFSRQQTKESHLYQVFFFLCKAIACTFVVSRTETVNGAIVYPWIADGLICNIVV